MTAEIKLLIEHIQKYTTYEWLVFIKVLESKTFEELEKIELDKTNLYNLQNSNWYPILLDFAIRFSDYKQNTTVNLKSLPKTYDYYNFISLYVNAKSAEQDFESDLNYDINLALIRHCGYDQLKYYQPPINDLGRLIKLYGEKEELFKQYFGLTPKQMIIFYMINNSKHNIVDPFTLNIMLKLLRDYDNTINEKKLEKFLDIFSISIKKYRLKAKALGISKNKIVAKRLIEQFPIISLNDNRYVIPSKMTLLYALTYQIFQTINDQKDKSGSFRRKFGETFENYVRSLTKLAHDDIFNECNDLIIEDKKRKAEFYLKNNDSCLIIESKLLHIDEDFIIHGKAQDLKSKFYSTLSDALEQIDSCIQNIKVKKHYAIIVVHTHLPNLQGINKFLDGKKYDFLDRVLVVSIIDFEMMIHHAFDDIIKYLEQPKEPISLKFFSTGHNKVLEDAFFKTMKEIKEK